MSDLQTNRRADGPSGLPAATSAWHGLEQLPSVLSCWGELLTVALCFTAHCSWRACWHREEPLRFHKMSMTKDKKQREIWDGEAFSLCFNSLKAKMFRQKKKKAAVSCKPPTRSCWGEAVWGSAAGILSMEPGPFSDLQFSQAAFPCAAHHLVLVRQT